MSKLIGLTGGIGSGKSRAAIYFKELGADVIDVDCLSKQLVEPGKPAWSELFKNFGSYYFNSDQSLNREKLAAEIFQNKEKRFLLEEIIHPRIFAEEQKLYKNYQQLNSEAIVVLDAALLIESGNYKNVDKVVVVRSSEKRQIQRIMSRNDTSKEGVKSRLKAQMPLEEKLKYSDYILNNDGSIEELKVQVRNLYMKLQQLP